MEHDQTTFRLADMTRARDFALKPPPEERYDLAAELGISSIRKLTFTGTLTPEGKRDWRLDGDLGATVVQPCVVTGDPVVTRIDDKVVRRYLSDMAPLSDLTEAESEMPEDETAEPLPAVLDLSEVMVEALSLALPDFPRVEGAEIEETTFAEPGVEPMSDDDAKPFASLAEFREKLQKKDE